MKIHRVRLAAQAIGSERLFAVASPTTAAQIESWRDLKAALQSVPHVAYDVDRPLLREWCDWNGVDLKAQQPSVTASDIRLLRTLVEANVGWSVIPDYLCQSGIERGSIVRLKGAKEPPKNTFYLVWAKSALRSPRVAYTRTMLLETLAK